MDEITTAAIIFKQLFVVNSKQARAFKIIRRVVENKDVELELQLLQKQHEDFCSILKIQLKKIRNDGVNILIHDYKVEECSTDKYLEANIFEIYAMLYKLQKPLISEYQLSISMISNNKEIKNILDQQHKAVEASLEKLKTIPEKLCSKVAYA